MSNTNNSILVGALAGDKLIGLNGLTLFWDKVKAYFDPRITALTETVGDSTKGLVKDVKSIQDELNSLSGGAGSIATQIENAITALDLPNTYDAKGAAGTAEQNAKDYTDEKLGAYTVGETPATGIRAEIETKEKALLDAISTVAADAKSYSITKVTEGLGANVKEAYKLVDKDGVQAGAQIDIYKDSALQSVVLDGQELVFTYLLATGAKDVVRVDVSSFLAESEFKNGLQVVDHVVSVKVDDASEAFLTVGTEGVKLSGVQSAIDTAVNSAFGSVSHPIENVHVGADAGVALALNDKTLSVTVTPGTVSSGDTSVVTGQEVYHVLESYKDIITTEINATIEENERVTSEALNDLNSRVTANTEAIATKVGSADVDSAISTALGSYSVKDAEGNVTTAATGLRKEIEDLDAADRAYVGTVLSAILVATDSDIENIFA